MMPPTPPHRRSSRIPGVVLVLASGLSIGVTAGLAMRSLDSAARIPAGSSEPTVLGEPVVVTPTVPPVTAPSTTAAPATTEAPAVTSTTSSTIAPPPPAPSFRRGDAGAEVTALQQRLVDLGFWVPSIDGTYGSVTAQAVMAFQKSAGLARDGIAGPDTLAALDTAAPVVAREAGDHIEIDLERQLMIVVHGDRTVAFNTSTGAEGWRTPTGRFAILREIDGMRHAELGDLYRPKYFNRGIALHGSPSIPGYPASHGCARLHDAVVDHIWAEGLAPVGTPVWVY